MLMSLVVVQSESGCESVGYSIESVMAVPEILQIQNYSLYLLNLTACDSQ